MPQTTIPEAIQNPQLIARFEARRADFLRSLKRLRPADAANDDRVGGILTELHKLAGVASLFGAEQLGTHATAYHLKLKNAPVGSRPEILREMLRVFSDDKR
ncbi:hypothetical protein B2G71_10430 [Novosphingobium sp. PC22D]|uniref:Hpt domain-containing protein n=1 Tax=Novosphingobium sp. PC22D TaxID=1962403 RepID=UPI000BF144F2|nr:Hpt domain-containing protein [Novosphingobium sp. PC22D]PEQ12711.1 hypothetical protein B2G71_10430 [Novosphingobium sp. PC22D]